MIKKAKWKSEGKSNPAPTVSETTYARIRSDILSGNLTPGVKLKLDELRAEYKVSVNTLRETLSHLKADGFVTAEGQKGFTVVPVSLDDLKELIEMRILLECHGLRLSIDKGDLEWEGLVVATNHKLLATEKLMLNDEKSNTGDWEAFDREFHYALVAACGNNQLIRSHHVIYDLFHRYQLMAQKSRPFRREDSSTEHRQILECVMERNANAAVDTLTKHIQRAILFSDNADQHR